MVRPRITTERFIERAKKIHENLDFSKTIYTGSFGKVTITCPTHGDFTIGASALLNRRLFKGEYVYSGCQKCGWEKFKKANTSTQDEIIRKFVARHSNKYDYSCVEYKNYRTKVKIMCRSHGEFYIDPSNHTRGSGCVNCFLDSERGTTESFIDKATKKHNGKYDYCESVYTLCDKKVKIKCPTHGFFWQVAEYHIDGNGCPKCSNNFSKPEIAWLNSLNIPDDKEHRQVSLKINKKRVFVDGFDPITKTVYEFNGDYWHGNPNKFKSDDINKRSKKTFGELYQKTLDKEQLIKSAGYNLVSIWESDYSCI